MQVPDSHSSADKPGETSALGAIGVGAGGLLDD